MSTRAVPAVAAGRATPGSGAPAGRRASGGAPRREEHWLDGPMPFVGPGTTG
ncbi:hypothetical protein [Streptomyces sp. NPDC000931]|uniref:hypothetical protein n=1 Tax=Streptomyces sp. NPDC000931 TaxID=3154372 RepID=UPI003320EC4E